MRISDWSADVCSSDLGEVGVAALLVLRRRLQDQHLGAVLARRHRRAQRRVAGSDHHHRFRHRPLLDSGPAAGRQSRDVAESTAKSKIQYKRILIKKWELENVGFGIRARQSYRPLLENG